MEYAVIVRTDSYAGNFERELCAHLTGQIGECEVGEEYVDSEVAEIFEDVVNQKPDDHACYRPVSLGGCNLTKDYNSQDVVIWFTETPDKEQIDLIKERAKTFSDIYVAKREWNKPVKILEIEAIKILTQITVKPIEL